MTKSDVRFEIWTRVPDLSQQERNELYEWVISKPRWRWRKCLEFLYFESKEWDYQWVFNHVQEEE